MARAHPEYSFSTMSSLFSRKRELFYYKRISLVGSSDGGRPERGQRSRVLSMTIKYSQDCRTDIFEAVAEVATIEKKVTGFDDVRRALERDLEASFGHVECSSTPSRCDGKGPVLAFAGNWLRTKSMPRPEYMGESRAPFKTGGVLDEGRLAFAGNIQDGLAARAANQLRDAEVERFGKPAERRRGGGAITSFDFRNRCAADAAPHGKLIEGQFAFGAPPLQGVSEFRWRGHDSFRLIGQTNIT